MYILLYMQNMNSAPQNNNNPPVTLDRLGNLQEKKKGFQATAEKIRTDLQILERTPDGPQKNGKRSALESMLNEAESEIIKINNQLFAKEQAGDKKYINGWDDINSGGHSKDDREDIKEIGRRTSGQSSGSKPHTY